MAVSEMFTQQTLAVAALLTSIVSMLLSMIALWPQWKDQLAVLRDFVLWTALAVMVVGIVGINWRKSVDAYNSQAGIQNGAFSSLNRADRLSPSSPNSISSFENRSPRPTKAP